MSVCNDVPIMSPPTLECSAAMERKLSDVLQWLLSCHVGTLSDTAEGHKTGNTWFWLVDFTNNGFWLVYRWQERRPELYIQRTLSRHWHPSFCHTLLTTLELCVLTGDWNGDNMFSWRFHHKYQEFMLHINSWRINCLKFLLLSSQ